MDEIQLNKPLYKSESSAGSRSDDSQKPIPVERPAKPLLWARSGAFVLDILILHFVLLGAIKLAPDFTVRLGFLGPWVGLAVGIIYLGIGASTVIAGRTLGKMVLRLQVVDQSGPDLSIGKGLLRSLLILWPLSVTIILRMIGEKNTRYDELTLAPVLPMLGVGLTGAWVLGNFLHALTDLHGRTMYDRWIGSVVISSEASPAAVADALRFMREQPDRKRERRAWMMHWSVLAALMALSVFQLVMLRRDLRNKPEEERSRIINGMKQQVVTGFGIPMQPVLIPAGTKRKEVRGLSTTDEAEDTTVALFQYTLRSPIDTKELSGNPEVMNAVDRISAFYQKLFAEEVKKGNKPTRDDDHWKFRTSFAEYSDLLFAWKANDVYEIDKMVHFETSSTTGTMETTGTTAAAASLPESSETATTAPMVGKTTPDTVSPEDGLTTRGS